MEMRRCVCVRRRTMIVIVPDYTTMGVELDNDYHVYH
jgi:hypothetical protein